MLMRIAEGHGRDTIMASILACAVFCAPGKRVMAKKNA